jgi:hypothetical protein
MAALNAEGAMTFSKDLGEKLASDPILGLGAARSYAKGSPDDGAGSVNMWLRC